MAKGMTAEERRAVDKALAEGRVTRIAATQARQCGKRASLAEWDADRRAGARRPTGPAPREVQAMGIREALEWAFGVEHARLDADPVGASSGGQRPGVGMEFVLMQRAMLGGVRIDTSAGRSLPADDAELLAGAVQAALPMSAGPDAVGALDVAEYARAGLAPDPLVGASPRCVPMGWHRNPQGALGKTAVLPREEYVVNGRVRRFEPVVVPVTYAPTWRQIAAARRRYLNWWRAAVGGGGGPGGAAVVDRADRRDAAAVALAERVLTGAQCRKRWLPSAHGPN